jgi:small-conductance mechanosensitive channel
MENNVSVWKANLTNGLILGLVGIVYSLVMYFMNLTFNKTVGYIFLLVLIILLFFLVRSYRDNYLYGYITFGKAFGTGVVIFLYYSIIAAIFTYILYAVIDPGLSAKQLAFTEEIMSKRAMPQEALDAAMKIQKKIMKPEIIAPFSIVGNMLYGTVMSLIVAIFVRKEGNPLIDAPEVK